MNTAEIKWLYATVSLTTIIVPTLEPTLWSVTEDSRAAIGSHRLLHLRVAAISWHGLVKCVRSMTQHFPHSCFSIKTWCIIVRPPNMQCEYKHTSTVNHNTHTHRICAVHLQTLHGCTWIQQSFVIKILCVFTNYKDANIHAMHVNRTVALNVVTVN